MHEPLSVAMVHYKTGGTDGVSLEMDKWAAALKALGHRVYLLGGEEGDAGKIIHPSLLHSSDAAKRMYAYTFKSQPTFESEQAFMETLLREAEKAERVIGSFVSSRHIQLVIPQNIWSVAMNPAVALAMERVCKTQRLKVLAQHHDFYWERPDGVHYPTFAVRKFADTYLPPRNPDYRHVVINRQGHDTLLKRTGLESTIIPNVFDFDARPWVKDRYNGDLKKVLGLTSDDIILLQATRIVERKGIELAIDLAAWLNGMRPKLEGKRLYDGRVVGKGSSFTVVLAGYDQDDDTGTYLQRLLHHAHEQQVRVVCAGPYIAHERKTDGGRKTYSLWDSYTLADLITYPSYWEGWGNQFLEGVFAKVPMAVFEYPVFKTDIKPVGYQYASLGSTLRRGRDNLVSIGEEALERAGKQVLGYLFDPDLRRRAVERNFELGRRHNSTETLKQMLREVLPATPI